MRKTVFKQVEENFTLELFEVDVFTEEDKRDSTKSLLKDFVWGKPGKKIFSEIEGLQLEFSRAIQFALEKQTGAVGSIKAFIPEWLEVNLPKLKFKANLLELTFKNPVKAYSFDFSETEKMFRR
jgi:hypothetical protein